MILNLYSLYDKKAEVFEAPRVYRTTAEALRAVYGAYLAGDNNLATFPDDYVLFIIGTFEDTTCMIDTNDLGLVKLGTVTKIVHMANREKEKPKDEKTELFREDEIIARLKEHGKLLEKDDDMDLTAEEK